MDKCRRKKYELVDGGMTLLRANKDCDELILDTNIGANILNKLAVADNKNIDGITFLSNFNCKKKQKILLMQPRYIDTMKDN